MNISVYNYATYPGHIYNQYIFAILYIIDILGISFLQLKKKKKLYFHI